jgi:hypothetical protein
MRKKLIAPKKKMKKQKNVKRRSNFFLSTKSPLEFTNGLFYQHFFPCKKPDTLRNLSRLQGP